MDRSSKERSPSVNSISSDDSILSDKPILKKKRKKNTESDASHEAEAQGNGAYNCQINRFIVNLDVLTFQKRSMVQCCLEWVDIQCTILKPANG